MLLFKPLASRLMVSTHSRPKAAGRNWCCPHWVTRWFQHTAARRRLAAIPACLPLPTRFQHTAARRRLDVPLTKRAIAILVSTHSRPKAAGCPPNQTCHRPIGFNTQPPEGGWYPVDKAQFAAKMFQHTAARRRLVVASLLAGTVTAVSTHSRPKAAGKEQLEKLRLEQVSTHSRPKAAGLALYSPPPYCHLFQHTAARRRLGLAIKPFSPSSSRFNTQPPEGGWIITSCFRSERVKFQHTAARRRLVRLKGVEMQSNLFQHTAARRRLA